jgi:cytidine deaminase
VTDAGSLLQKAREAAERAYVPYSRFRVGAAILAGGSVFTGCNVENASFGLTICAERNTIFHAVAAGHRRIDALAVACIDATRGGPIGLRMPCGACRQVMAEFGVDDLPIEIDGVGAFRLHNLLPSAFRF